MGWSWGKRDDGRRAECEIPKLRAPEEEQGLLL